LFIAQTVPLFQSRVRPIYNPKRIFKYSLPLYPNSIMVTLQHWVDTLFLGKFVPSASDVGVYRVAARTGFVGRSQLQALSSIFAPTVADHYHQGRLERISRLYKTTTRWSIMTGFPLYVFLWLFPGVVLSLFGHEYASGAAVLRIVIIGHVCHISTGSSGQILAMTGHQRMNMWISVASLLVTLAFMMLLVPHYQLIGAAWATTAAVFLTNFLYVVAIAVLLKMQPFTWTQLRPVGAAFAAGLLTLWVTRMMLPVELHRSPLATVRALLPVTIIFTIAYALFQWFVGFEPEDGEIWREIKEKLRPSVKG
jgi:O-antigen/teichoic acid export membrane protein